MNLSRCENGHFYDKEKYASCPHCAEGNVMEEGMTVSFDEDTAGSEVAATMPLEGISGGSPAGGREVPPAAPVFNIPSPAEDATEKLQNSVMGGFSSIPSADTPMSVAPTVDDDHTVAFYDDIFADEDPVSAAPAPSPVAVTPPPAPKPHRVSTPCVGWLVALNGVHAGQDFRLKVGKNFVGRDLSMDIVLDGEKSVSRNKHAIIVYEPKQHLYLVQPGESSELVYLNG